MGPDKNYRKTIGRILIILLIALSIYYIILVVIAAELTKLNFFLILVFSHVLTSCMLWGMVKLLMKLTSRADLQFLSKIRANHSVSDFIIGDDGGYSLSRLQMVIWAITIISYQLSVLLTLLLLKDPSGDRSYLFYYELDFSESALWLLGLSLMSYVSVKGITMEQTKRKPLVFKKKEFKRPEPIDIISGPNGLDFSKCQMALWTLMAIFIFNSRVYEFNKAIYRQGRSHNSGEIVKTFSRHYEEYSENEREKLYDPTKPFVPYLPWAFIVLMGLSQGAYVGKKLVPTHKVDSVKEGLKDKIASLMDGLLIKKDLFSQQLALTKGQTLSPGDQQNLLVRQAEIKAMETDLARLNLELEKIETVTV
jgi:hypothetical protein